MYNLEQFGLGDMTGLGLALRGLADGGSSPDEVGSRMVRHLYEELRGPDSTTRACALVRLFVTRRLGDLPEATRTAAVQALGGGGCDEAIPCLTLAASAGDEEDWNHVDRSVAHRAIPLHTPAAVRQSPMIAQLIDQLEIDVAHFVETDPGIVLSLAQRSFGVFHVEKARGSRHIPAQDEFVARYGIQSVVGFGGILPTGSFFCVVMFSRIPVSRTVAGRFKTVALSVKLALLPYGGA